MTSTATHNSKINWKLIHKNTKTFSKENENGSNYWLLNVWMANLSLIFWHLYFLNTCYRPERVLNTEVPKQTYSQREFTKSRYWAHFMLTVDYMMKRIKYQLEWGQVWARAIIVKHTLESLQYCLNLEIWNGLYSLDI